jgi:hypothetical protein
MIATGRAAMDAATFFWIVSATAAAIIGPLSR